MRFDNNPRTDIELLQFHIESMIKTNLKVYLSAGSLKSRKNHWAGFGDNLLEQQAFFIMKYKEFGVK